MQFQSYFPYYHDDLQLLSPQEQKAYMLFILDFSVQEITVLLDVSEQRISNIKSGINQKLFCDSSATTLQRNIRKRKKQVHFPDV